MKELILHLSEDYYLKYVIVFAISASISFISLSSTMLHLLSKNRRSAKVSSIILMFALAPALITSFALYQNYTKSEELHLQQIEISNVRFEDFENVDQRLTRHYRSSQTVKLATIHSLDNRFKDQSISIKLAPDSSTVYLVTAEDGFAFRIKREDLDPLLIKEGEE